MATAGRSLTSSVAAGNSASNTRRSSPCEDGYVYIPLAFVVLLYLVYLVECWHCHTRIQLQCRVSVQTVYDRIQAMREAVPIVWWKATCYHYVRRTRQVTHYRNGDAFMTSQAFYERVNVHSVCRVFDYGACGGYRDVSKHPINLEKYPATKIRLTKGFAFASIDAELDYEEQRSNFFQEHDYHDDHMEAREGLDLLNAPFREHMIACVDGRHLPWYVSQPAFWLFSCLLLSWPLRVLIEHRTAYMHLHVCKVFGTRSGPQPALLPSNASASSSSSGSLLPRRQSGIISTLPHASTVFSLNDLDCVAQNNCIVVPSYSEALLLNAEGSGGKLAGSAKSLTFLSSATPLSPSASLGGGGEFASLSRYHSNHYHRSLQRHAGFQHHRHQQLQRQRTDAIASPSGDEGNKVKVKGKTMSFMTKSLSGDFSAARSLYYGAARLLSPSGWTLGMRMEEREEEEEEAEGERTHLLRHHHHPQQQQQETDSCSPHGTCGVRIGRSSSNRVKDAQGQRSSTDVDTPPAYEDALLMQVFIPSCDADTNRPSSDSLPRSSRSLGSPSNGGSNAAYANTELSVDPHLTRNSRPSPSSHARSTRNVSSDDETCFEETSF